MRAPDGRTFRPKTQADVNRDGRKADDILARRISRQPKVLPASGGISGVTRCDAGDYEIASAGASSTLQGIDWQFSDLFGSDGAGLSTGAEPYAVYVSSAGWYMPTLNFNVSWSSAPAGLAANITFTGDDSDYPTDWNPIYAPMGSTFAQVRLSLPGPWVLLPAGGWFRASLGWTSGPSVAAFHHFTLDVTKG